jgi:predicted nucleic acid-binding protein
MSRDTDGTAPAGGDPRPIVLDGSVLAKLVLPEELSDRAHALVRGAVAAGRPLRCPATALLDVADALHTHTLRDRVTASEAATAMAVLSDLPLETGVPHDYWPTVLAFARDHGLRHLQAAQAVVLAESCGGECWTGHRDTWSALHRAVPWLRWVGDASEG